MIASFDNPMAEHLRNMKNKEIHQQYLGPRIQTVLIYLIGNNERTEIVAYTQKAKYYTVWNSRCISQRTINIDNQNCTCY